MLPRYRMHVTRAKHLRTKIPQLAGRLPVHPTGKCTPVSRSEVKGKGQGHSLFISAYNYVVLRGDQKTIMFLYFSCSSVSILKVLKFEKKVNSFSCDSLFGFRADNTISWPLSNFSAHKYAFITHTVDRVSIKL